MNEWFQMAALMIGLFIGSWLPYALITFFSVVGFSHLVTPYWTSAATSGPELDVVRPGRHQG